MNYEYNVMYIETGQLHSNSMTKEDAQAFIDFYSTCQDFPLALVVRSVSDWREVV